MSHKVSLVIICFGRLHNKNLSLIIEEFEKKFQIIVIHDRLNIYLNSHKKKYSEVIWIEVSHNSEFAFAANKAILKSSAEYILFIDLDSLPTVDQIHSMIAFSKDGDVALSQKTYYDNFQKIKKFISDIVDCGSNRVKYPIVFKKNHFSCNLLLINSNTLKMVNGFDEGYVYGLAYFKILEKLRLAKAKIFLVDCVRFGKKIPLISYREHLLINKLLFNIFLNIFLPLFSKYISSWCNKLIFLKPEYSSKLISVVVPNMHQALMDKFLHDNNDFLTSDVELIIVSSSLNSSNIWSYRKKYPMVCFIPLMRNRGFVNTVNTGLRISSGIWVGTINDDVILAKGWAEKLIKNKNFEKIGSINPLIANIYKQIESSGITIDKKGKATCNLQRYDKLTHVDATNGACVLYSRFALAKVGLFSELFTSYLEDIDLSLRLERAGFVNVVDPSVEVTHLGHQTMNVVSVKKRWLDFKNWCLVIIRNWGWKKIVINLPAIILERMRNISGIIKAL